MVSKEYICVGCGMHQVVEVEPMVDVEYKDALEAENRKLRQQFIEQHKAHELMCRNCTTLKMINHGLISKADCEAIAKASQRDE